MREKGTSVRSIVGALVCAAAWLAAPGAASGAILTPADGVDEKALEEAEESDAETEEL